MLLLLVSICSCSSYMQGRHVVTTLKVTEDRSVSILADNYMEAAHGFYYQIELRKAKVVGPTFIGNGDEDDARFELLSSSDHDVIGIVEEHNRDVVLALHDFASGASWPGDIQGEEDRETATSLLQKLQENIPDLKVRLSRDVPGNIERKIY